MDRGQGFKDSELVAAKVNRFAWLPVHMPGVARLMGEKRTEMGAAHVAECWRRGVVGGEAGWFFAREGALAVGTPWDDAALAFFQGAQVVPGQALLMVRPR